MGFWGVVQIISLVTFIMGYGMFIGGGLTYAATNGEEIQSDEYYDICFTFGGISTIVFIIAVIANHGLFFLVR